MFSTPPESLINQINEHLGLTNHFLSQIIYECQLNYRNFVGSSFSSDPDPEGGLCVFRLLLQWTDVLVFVGMAAITVQDQAHLGVVIQFDLGMLTGSLALIQIKKKF